MERSMAAVGNNADIDAFQLARRQWRNYLVLRNAMATGGEETARGLLTPGKLEQAAASGPNRTWYAHGLSDFTDLAKAGKAGMSKMPESGTAARAAIHVLPALATSALMGGGVEGLAAGTAALAAPTIAGRVLMSRPVQALVGNQLMPRGTTRIGRGVGRTGRIAAAATPRIDAMKQAETVLSPKVLDHIKSATGTRKQLSDWVRAKNSGQNIEGATQALALAIAQEVKQPELADRIARELAGQQ
jgi:hypothetical protein